MKFNPTILNPDLGTNVVSNKASLLLPVPQILQNQSKLILKGVGSDLIKPLLFNPNYKKIAIEDQAYQRLDRVGYDIKGGAFGLPLWDTITLISPAYTDDSGKSIPSQRLRLNLALVEAENDRNIVVTKIAGRNGSVKEYMSDGDMMVTIRGSLIGNIPNIPPADLLTAYQFITTVPEALTVESNFLDYMQVFSLVVLTPKWKQREGARNIIDIELTCLSDTPLDLQFAET